MTLNTSTAGRRRTGTAFWGQRCVDRIQQLMLEWVAGSGAAVPSAVLDVGCGTGRLLEKAGAHWRAARLLGVDPAPGMIEVARRRICKGYDGCRGR